MAVLSYQLSLVWGEIIAVSILDEWETILSMCLCTVSEVMRVGIQCFYESFNIFFAHENMKKPASKVAHNRPEFFFQYCQPA